MNAHASRFGSTAVAVAISLVIAEFPTTSGQITYRPTASVFTDQAFSNSSLWFSNRWDLMRRAYVRGAAAWNLPYHRRVEEAAPRRIPESPRPIVALFDIHGTLLLPTWKAEFASVYAEGMKVSQEEAAEWAEKTLDPRSQAKAQNVKHLANNLGISEKEALFRLRKARNRADFSIAMPGAAAFLKALRSREVPLVGWSNSPTPLLFEQLAHAGLLQYFQSEYVFGGDRLLRSQPAHSVMTPQITERAIEDLRATTFPGHEFVLFDDWLDRIPAIEKTGGRVFVLPQGANAEWSDNRKKLVAAGAHYILHQGWSDWPEVLQMLDISKSRQRGAAQREQPVAEGKAEEIMLLAPAFRQNGLSLDIQVSDDLKTLTYSKVKSDHGVFQPNGKVNYSARVLRWLATFPSSYLISPERYMRYHLNRLLFWQIHKVWEKKKRYTTYRHLTTAWDIAADKDVWTTNIDTVFLDDRLLESNLLSKMQELGLLHKVTEIGTGGGHLASRLATYGIDELSITDISIYALRAALRNITVYLFPHTRLRTYWGKGLDLQNPDQDLIVINPPYIPYPVSEFKPDIDPYRGTGLIREVLEKGIHQLNPINPEASLVINISSLARNDWDRYQKEFGQDLLIEPLGKPLEVPLKITTISQTWKDWLVSEGGLRDRGSDTPEGEERYWHTLQAYRIRPRVNLYQSFPTVADPEDYHEASSLKQRQSVTGHMEWDEEGRPLNPVDRTLPEGKGPLFYYGANLAGDGILTRLNPQTGDLEALCVFRSKDKKWAGPGGYFDAKLDRDIIDAITRETNEEVSVPVDFRKGALEIHRGYVKDPRNRRNGWNESVALWKHLTPDEAAKVTPKPQKEEVDEVKWQPIEKINLNELYGSHGEFMSKIIELWHAGVNRPKDRPGIKDLNVEIAAYQRIIDRMKSGQASELEFVGERPKGEPGERIGYFGITANPVHNAHVSLVALELQERKVDSVVVVIGLDHVEKEYIGASYAERMAMIRHAYAHLPNVYFAFCKTGQYVDFAKTAKQLYPELHPYLLLGTENLEWMLTHRSAAYFKDLIQTGARWLVHHRYSAGENEILELLKTASPVLPAPYQTLGNFVGYFSVKLVSVSSTLLRILRLDGETFWKELTGSEVAEIIQERNLFRESVTSNDRARAYMEHQDLLEYAIRAGKLFYPQNWNHLRQAA